MTDPPLYYAAACQVDFENPTRRSQIGEHVARMLAMIEHAVSGYRPFFDVRLIVFPEFAHAAPIYPSAAEIREKLAVPIPNEFTALYEEKARALGVYIQTGTFLEASERYPGALFNTTCLIGPEGIVLTYRKVNTWIPWEVHSSPHDVPEYAEAFFPVARTPLGNIGVATCYDWLFPEVLRQLTFNGAEVLVRVSAYMDPWGATAPMDWWTLINRTRALENTAYVVAANQGARLSHYPPFSWPGGSMVVDYDGRIVAQADPGPGEKIVVGPIDIARLREERQRRQGHQMLAHLRTETLSMYREPIFGRARDPAAITYEENVERTSACTKRFLR